MRTTAAAALAAGLLLAGVTACGAPPEKATGPLPSDPTTLVLRVNELHSSPRPWERGQLPQFSLYGGGRVIVPDSGTEALRSAHEYQLAEDSYRALIADAYTAGLDHDHDHAYQGQTDASLLVVTFRTPNGVRTTRVTAPEVRGSGDRRRVLDFVRSLPRPPNATTAYRPTGLTVLATGGVDQGNIQPQPWPLRPLDQGTRTQEGLCAVVNGDDLAQVLRLAQGKRQEDSRWSSVGKTFAVSFRPLLPDEHSCQDIDQR
jgi:hypothetical protein